MAKLPVNLSKVREAWTEVGDLAERQVSISLAGDERLVAKAQDLLAEEGRIPAVVATSPEEWAQPVTHSGELLVVFGGSEQETEVLAAMEQGWVRGPVVMAVDEGPQATGDTVAVSRSVRRLSFSDTPLGWSRLLAACAQVAGQDLVALARHYTALRTTAARRVVNHTAAQNALIGFMVILPGADTPVMTMNQVKMVLQLAGIYGQRVDMERAVELAGVVGLGLGFRAVTRRLVVLVPGFGWLFKALIAYTATSAVGAAAMKYFERGAPLSTANTVALVKNLRR